MAGRKKQDPNNPDTWEHKPSDYSRGQVAAWSMAGVPLTTMCKLLGITTRTFHNHYENEYQEGKSLVHAKLVHKCLDVALEGNVAAIFFLLKTQFNYRESSKVDVTTNGESLTVNASAMSQVLTTVLAQNPQLEIHLPKQDEEQS